MSFDIEAPGDFFDSRDVTERIDELVNEIGDNTAPDDFVWEREELEALLVLAEEGRGATSEWDDGATFISDYYFEEYAEEFAYDIGAINRDAGGSGWPLNRIDWKAAAEDLLIDYTSVEIDGDMYWVRG